MTVFSAITSKFFAGTTALALAWGIWNAVQLSAARDANTLLTAQRDSAISDKRLCSASVDALKQLADERQKQADDNLALARQATARHQDTARDILKVPVPTPDKECAATLQLLKDFQ